MCFSMTSATSLAKKVLAFSNRAAISASSCVVAMAGDADGPSRVVTSPRGKARPSVTSWRWRGETRGPAWLNGSQPSPVSGGPDARTAPVSPPSRGWTALLTQMLRVSFPRLQPAPTLIEAPSLPRDAARTVEGVRAGFPEGQWPSYAVRQVLAASDGAGGRSGAGQSHGCVPVREMRACCPDPTPCGSTWRATHILPTVLPPLRDQRLPWGREGRADVRDGRAQRQGGGGGGVPVGRGGVVLPRDAGTVQARGTDGWTMAEQRRAGQSRSHLPRAPLPHRIYGRLSVVGAGGHAGQEWPGSPPLGELQSARRGAWARLSDEARKQFCWPQPGAGREADDAAFTGGGRCEECAGGGCVGCHDLSPVCPCMQTLRGCRGRGRTPRVTSAWWCCGRCRWTTCSCAATGDTWCGGGGWHAWVWMAMSVGTTAPPPFRSTRGLRTGAGPSEP